MNKPHIWWSEPLQDWCCTLPQRTLNGGLGLQVNGVVGVGPTPGDAYYNWRNTQ